MKQQWQSYSDKFLLLTAREQYMIIATGLVAITFICFSLFIDGKMIQLDKLTVQQNKNANEIRSTQTTIDVLAASLNNDPNTSIRNQIAHYQQEMNKVDENLALLASDLINPIQMRHALIDLLSTKRGVSLVSFEIVNTEPMQLPNTTTSETTESADKASISLYKHGVKLKLSGRYFALKDYLAAVEKMKWKFFWQDFDYQLVAYPKGELTITMYSLSTNKEFLGV